jgi:hypothetical protein
VEAALVRTRATIRRAKGTWHLGIFAKTLMETMILICQSPYCAKITNVAQKLRTRIGKKVTMNKKYT